MILSPGIGSGHSWKAQGARLDHLNPLDVDALARSFRSAEPFPYLVLEDFLEPAFARAVAASYPPFEQASQVGLQFTKVNERRKVQVCDAQLFPPPVKQLADLVNGSEFLALLERVTGIPNLLADETFGGGGIHETAAGGWLDVHVDFNYFEQRDWHRRLNLLIFLNEEWPEAWGGQFELWDPEVKRCHRSLVPLLNRAALFETSQISYHGVQRITCPDGVYRKSFAAYYYTKEAPAGWDGAKHSTIFRARPEERWKGLVAMPLEKASAMARTLPRRLARLVRGGRR
jgi:hypothetical protein